MRLESIHVRNLGPFRDYSLDLGSLPPEARLVAIAGQNGAGKSTLLELWTGGALYRECATRGSLAALATARDASLEARVSNGKPWTIRHTIDAVSGKGESVALDSSGAPATSSGKVRDFERWASDTLPPPEVLYASTVAAQGSGGFLDLKAGDRKATLLRILGVERLEGLAKAARERASAQRSEADTLQARLTDEAARGGDVAELERQLERARSELATREVGLTQAREQLDAGRAELARYRTASSDYDASAVAWGKLSRDLEAAQAEVEHLTRRIENNRALLADADAVRGAVDTVRRLEGERETLRARDAALAADLSSLTARESAAGRHLVSLTARIAQERSRADEALARLARSGEAEAAVAAVPELRSDTELCQCYLDSAERELEKLRGQRVAGAEERIDSLRRVLGWIAEGGEDPASLARVALDLDAQSAAAAAELPTRLGEAYGAVEVRRGALAKAQSRLAKASEVAALAERMASDRVELDCLELAIAELHDEAKRVESERVELSTKIQCASSERQFVARSIKEHESDLAASRRIADKFERLAQAEARIAELEPQVAVASARVVSLRRELDELPVPDRPDPPQANVAVLESSLEAASESRDTAVAVVARLDADVERARASEMRRSELSATLSACSTELGDWARLAADLGRDGLQATLIDAAGPELTALTNDLLHSCVGSRWTVSFETTRLSADGRKQLEGLDVRVIDSERGRDANAETLSGGERVLVGEAVSLALSVLACRRAGIERPTLVRDESGAALDPERGRAYVAMLRRAVDLTGADRCLLVSHSPDVQALCDVRIDVGDAP